MWPGTSVVIMVPSENSVKFAPTAARQAGPLGQILDQPMQI
jgi:hypothetical protein